MIYDPDHLLSHKTLDGSCVVPVDVGEEAFFDHLDEERCYLYAGWNPVGAGTQVLPRDERG